MNWWFSATMATVFKERQLTPYDLQNNGLEINAWFNTSSLTSDG